jgi:hypothetical protein
MGWFTSLVTGCNSACEAAKREEVRQFNCQTAYKMSCEAWAAKQAAIKKENEKIEAANKAAKEKYEADKEKYEADKRVKISESGSANLKSRSKFKAIHTSSGDRASRSIRRSEINVPKIATPIAMYANAAAAPKRKRLKMFSADDSDFGNVNDLYGMKRGGVTMASRRGDGAAIRGKTRAGMK